MIKRVTDCAFDNVHEGRVARKVSELQEQGNEVTRILTVERMTFGIFGVNTTDIYYQAREQKS